MSAPNKRSIAFWASMRFLAAVVACGLTAGVGLGLFVADSVPWALLFGIMALACLALACVCFPINGEKK